MYRANYSNASCLIANLFPLFCKTPSGICEVHISIDLFLVYILLIHLSISFFFCGNNFYFILFYLFGFSIFFKIHCISAIRVSHLTLTFEIKTYKPPKYPYSLQFTINFQIYFTSPKVCPAVIWLKIAFNL